MSEHTLRIVIGVIGALIIVTRVFGFIYPDRLKAGAGRMAALNQGWIRLIATLLALGGLFLLYSTLVEIFQVLPVFMIVCFTVGLILLVVGAFAVHPVWFKQTLEELFIKRGAFFVRAICFLGILGGVFILLSAIFGYSWGGLAH